MPIAPSAISTQPHHGTPVSDPFSGVVDVGAIRTLLVWVVPVFVRDAAGTVWVWVFVTADDVWVLVFVTVVVRAGSVTVLVVPGSVVFDAAV